MIATENGFLYNIENKQVISEIFIGNRFEIPITSAVFYGSKEEAVLFGLFFDDEAN